MDLILSQVINVDRLQGLFDAFYSAVGISTAIIDRDGTILISSDWQRICSEFHRKNPDSAKQCIQSNRKTHQDLANGDEKLVYQCPHGLIDAATPIVVDGRHMADLYAGQILFEPLTPPTIADFKHRAGKWGYDEDAYLKALKQVPIVSKARVTLTLEYLKQLAEMIGEVGLSRLRQNQSEAAMLIAHAALKQEVAQREQDAKKLTEILSGSPIPTFVIDAAGMVIHWNHGCEVLTGVPAEKVIGTDHHRSVFYPKTRDLLSDTLVKAGGINQLTLLYGTKFRSAQHTTDGFEGEDFFPHLGKNGKWIFFTAAPLKDADGSITGAIETIQDVTAHKIAEQEILSSEARYRQLFESAHDAIFILKGIVLIDCNQRALELFGRSRNEMIGRTPLDYSPEQQTDGVLSVDSIQKREALVMQSGPQFFEWRFIHKNGAPFDVEVSLNRFEIADSPHLLAIVRDITNRKQMTRMLQEREKELDEKSRYLERVNQALKASLDHREVEKRAIEENILVNLKRFVFPYLEDLGRCTISVEARAYLNIIETNLKDTVSQFSETIFSKYLDFTPTEVRVADLIRKGRNTKEIANLLALSPSSIQWHRKNIREKLGLTQKRVNLYTYLNSLSR